MSIVTLEFDNKLTKSTIEMPIHSSSKQEAGEDYYDSNLTDKAQTSVFGIQTPLIAINNTIIDFDSIRYFSLKSQGRLPELVMTVEDQYEIITNIDKPGNDNEVRVQILPRFDNAYKKVDLTFYITSIIVMGKQLQLTCAYKVPTLLSSHFKTYGEIDTYSLFKQVASETQLGFATNIAKINDTRFAYCNNRTLVDMMEDEIQFANATDHILDWWVDLWDNLNLVDIKERYNAVDSNDDLQIWISGQVNDVTAGNTPEAQRVVASINNHPSFKMSELFVTSYSINNNPGMQIAMGTDKVCGVYEEDKLDYEDHLIQDGDIKNDIFAKYDYIGENYGEYNYMLAKPLREAYIQKIHADTITVTMKSPLLALMRGHRVNFIRYTNDDKIENKIKTLEEAGFADRNVESNISLKEYEITEPSDNGKFVIDRTSSGQYLILSVNITYTNNNWEYILTLAKPASTKTSILK